MTFFQRLKSNLIWRFIFLLLLISIIAIFIVHLTHTIFDYHDEEEIHFFIFIATVSLGIIAYYEFSRSNKLTANEFLIFISNRWGNIEIVKARQVLHKIFIDAYRDKDGNKKCEYGIALSNASKEILRMSRFAGCEGKKFIYLLNLLDYLETVN